MNNKGKITSVSFALMLIISTFAFAYMIGSETKIALGAESQIVSTINFTAGDKPRITDGYLIDTEGGVTEIKTGKLWRSGVSMMKGDDPITTFTQSELKPLIDEATSGINFGKEDTTTQIPEYNAAGLSSKEYNSYLIELSDDKYMEISSGKVYSSPDDYAYFPDKVIGQIGEEESDLLALGVSIPTAAPASVINAPAAAPNIESDTPEILTDPDILSAKKLDNGNYEIQYKNSDKIKVYNSDGELVSSRDSVKTYLTQQEAIAGVGKESYNSNLKYYSTDSGAIYGVDTNGKTTWEGRGTMENPFGKGQVGWGAGQLLEGLKWAGIAATLSITLGSLFIKDKAEVTAMTAGITAGVLVGKSAYALLGNGGFRGITGEGKTVMGVGTSWLSSPWTSAAIGAATAWLVYNAMWSSEKVSVETVTFNCLPWEAPHGGNDCELCNDASLPCSEYRCKSLGQSCAIVNKGTKSEKCVNVNPRDSSPPVIKPLDAAVTSGYEYFDIREMPPGAGFKLRSKTQGTGCIPAYTPIQFGIVTNEPSQCKIDIEAKGNYSKMATYMNGDNLYQYNHTEFLNLPSSADLKNSSLTLKNGKELTFYIRCIDAAGNANEADYALTMCVDPSPDTTAPLIQGTSIATKGCVPADAVNATVEFYVNEPAQCNWDYYDRDYDQMKNSMTCSTQPAEINAMQSYTCTTKLAGIARDGTNFFVRCKDQPGDNVNESKRNKMQESYVFNLRGSSQLKLKVLRPNETIYGAVRPTPVELYAETLYGCEDSKAICYYSTTGAANSFVQFFDTDKTDGVHTQRLDLLDGMHNYFVRCIDAGGNIVNQTTTFKVSIDVNAPVVARAYEEEGYLKLVTPLNSECVYNTQSCDYLFSEGISMPYPNSTAHVTEWFPDKKYFIKCRDEYRSEPADCSLVVRPTENFLGE